MSRQSTGLSRNEKRAQRSPPSSRQLLCTRKDAAELLRCSVSTVVRLEHQGTLKPLRLTRSPSSQIYLRMEDILALVEQRVEGEDEEDA
jgi:hypothetical protein